MDDITEGVRGFRNVVKATLVQVGRLGNGAVQAEFRP